VIETSCRVEGLEGFNPRDLIVGSFVHYCMMPGHKHRPYNPYQVKLQVISLIDGEDRSPGVQEQRNELFQSVSTRF
jgi:hypothetical protein